MSESFRRGDVVRIEVNECPKGFAVVMDDENSAGPTLKVHDGCSFSRCHYIHPGWCRKVGEAGEDVLRACEASHTAKKAIDDEREERQRAFEAAEARLAEKIAGNFSQLSDKYKAEVARAIRAFDAYKGDAVSELTDHEYVTDEMLDAACRKSREVDLTSKLRYPDTAESRRQRIRQVVEAAMAADSRRSPDLATAEIDRLKARVAELEAGHE